jgi:hypothetical protein
MDRGAPPEDKIGEDHQRVLHPIDRLVVFNPEKDESLSSMFKTPFRNRSNRGGYSG